MFYFWAFFNPWPNICIYSGKFIWVSLWYIIVTKDFNIQFVFSNNKHILVDGEWSVWSLWSECSATCGYDATAIRTRACDSPSPLHGGQTCSGSQEETNECNPAAPLCMSKTFYVNICHWNCMGRNCMYIFYMHMYKVYVIGQKQC